MFFLLDHMCMLLQESQAVMHALHLPCNLPTHLFSIVNDTLCVLHWFVHFAKHITFHTQTAYRHTHIQSVLQWDCDRWFVADQYVFHWVYTWLWVVSTLWILLIIIAKVTVKKRGRSDLPLQWRSHHWSLVVFLSVELFYGLWVQWSYPWSLLGTQLVLWSFAHHSRNRDCQMNFILVLWFGMSIFIIQHGLLHIYNMTWHPICFSWVPLVCGYYHL